MPLNSNSLFHFTRGGLDILKLILSSGFGPSYVREANVARLVSSQSNPSIGYRSVPNEDIPYQFYLNIPVVSFCDIPLAAVNSHTQRYSKKNQESNTYEVCAIGLSKEWGINKGINPITYYVAGGRLSRALSGMVKPPAEPVKKMAVPEGQHYIAPDVYCPPIEMGHGSMVVDNKGYEYPIHTLYAKPLKQVYSHGEEVFHEEREWRYIPENARIISDMAQMRSSNSYRTYQIEADNAKNAINEVKDNYPYDYLGFDIDDITHIIVNKENEILTFLEFLNQNYSGVEDRKLYTLFSKVTSYERIVNDFSIF